MKHNAGLASVLVLLLATSACEPPAREGFAGSVARGALERDIEGYAVASCLAALDDPHLNEQGQAWAGAIVQRSHGSIDAFVSIFDAVKAEMARMPMAMGHDEDAPQVPKPMPVLYCAELIDSPAVRAAIGQAGTMLNEAYGSQ